MMGTSTMAEELRGIIKLIFMIDGGLMSVLSAAV